MFILFLSIYIFVYGGMNLYFFYKLRAVFNFSPKFSFFLLVLFFVACPILVRVFEDHKFYFMAQSFSYIGYTWMGFMLVFCVISGGLDFFRLILLFLGKFLKDWNFLSRTSLRGKLFFASCAISIAIVIYGHFEASDIKIEKISIETPKISKDIGVIRIVQISDLHLGLMVRENRLKKVVNIISKINPDILVSTGDLVDAVIDGKNKYIELLKELNAKYGKYAVTGNHEFFAGIEESLSFTEKSGFKILRGESIALKGILNISGVDDSVGKMYKIYSNVTAANAPGMPGDTGFPQSQLVGAENNLAEKLPIGEFSILLKHRPVFESYTGSCFDLQLSGHTHKGQIFPFNFFIRLFYPHYAGLWNNGNNSYLYVSRGTGTWGPLMRFLAPPEITIIELIPA